VTPLPLLSVLAALVELKICREMVWSVLTAAILL
jgi:hypothetical protein